MDGISVLTLVGGRPMHLRRMIEALARSSLLPQELVVGVLEAGAPEMCEAPFPVRMMELPTDAANGSRLRLAEARNLTARAARGKILMFLDVDCMASADMLGSVWEILDREDAIVCPEVFYLRHPVTSGWEQADLAASGVPHPARIFPPAGACIELNAGLLWSLAFALRATMFHQIGGFDAGYIGYGAEDTDFAYSAQACGTPLLFMGGAPVFHQNHAVYHPPLQHFDDIVLNAQRFMKTWGTWPMGDWLASFAGLGLIAWHPKAQTMTVLRSPHPAEVAAALQPPGTPY